MKDDIRGEVAVVTGASRGLGLLLARELARHGCPLFSARAMRPSWNGPWRSSCALPVPR